MTCRRRAPARPAIRYSALSTPRNALPGSRNAAGSSDLILAEPKDPQARLAALVGVVIPLTKSAFNWPGIQPKSLFALKENLTDRDR